MSVSTTARPYLIDSLYTHKRLQIRGGTKYSTVLKYKRDMKAGDVFPPVHLVENGGRLYVIDGHHRIEAAAACGHTSISGIHKRMSLEDAQREALLANNKLGRPPSQKEKHYAFASFIEHGLHLDLSGKVKPLRTIAAEFRLYAFQTVSRKLKEFGIKAPREDVIDDYRFTGRNNGEPSPEDLKQEDDVLLGEFHKHLEAATAAYSLLSDTSRSSALGALSALWERLKPTLGYLEI